MMLVGSYRCNAYEKDALDVFIQKDGCVSFDITVDGYTETILLTQDQVRELIKDLENSIGEIKRNK